MSVPEPHSPSTRARAWICPSGNDGTLFTSQLAAEDAMLQRAEERVEFCQGGALSAHQFVDGGSATSELVLVITWRRDDRHLLHVTEIDSANGYAFRVRRHPTLKCFCS